MPIHLAPISRRRFLARTLAAGAGLVLGPELLAAGKPVAKHSWALFSDLHLAADRGLKARGINMTEHFQAVSRDVLSLQERPAGLFITGDCAYNSGQPADYAVLADLLLPLRQGQIPVHLALGNHDDREHFWEAFREESQARRPLADRQVGLVQTPRADWYILDSLEKTLSTPGLLGREQLDWLAQSLDANRKKPALVLLHHNPGLDGNLGLKDTLALLEVLRPRKQVKAYIFGHTHTWKVEQDPSGLYLVNLPTTAYVFRAGEPSGWVHATLERQGMQLELRCVDPTHKDQGQTVRLTWRT